jgi:hypothetical protein
MGDNQESRQALSEFLQNAKNALAQIQEATGMLAVVKLPKAPEGPMTVKQKSFSEFETEIENTEINGWAYQYVFPEKKPGVIAFATVDRDMPVTILRQDGHIKGFMYGQKQGDDPALKLVLSENPDITPPHLAATADGFKVMHGGAREGGVDFDVPSNIPLTITAANGGKIDFSTHPQGPHRFNVIYDANSQKGEVTFGKSMELMILGSGKIRVSPQQAASLLERYTDPDIKKFSPERFDFDVIDSVEKPKENPFLESEQQVRHDRLILNPGFPLGAMAFPIAGWEGTPSDISLDIAAPNQPTRSIELYKQSKPIDSLPQKLVNTGNKMLDEKRFLELTPPPGRDR